VSRRGTHKDLQTGADIWVDYIQTAVPLGKEKPECEPQHWIPVSPYWLIGSSLAGFVSACSSYGWPRQIWCGFTPCCVDLSSGTEIVIAIWLSDQASVDGPPLFSSVERQAARVFLFAHPAPVIWENGAQPWNSRNDEWIWYRVTDFFIASLDTLLAFETSTNKDSNIPSRRQIQKPIACSVVCLAVFQAFKFFWKVLKSVGQGTVIVVTSFPAVAQREP